MINNYFHLLSLISNNISAVSEYELSHKNSVYNNNDIFLTNITDLTFIENIINIEDKSNFKQILQIYIYPACKYNVLYLVNKFNALPIIYFAEPIFKLAIKCYSFNYNLNDPYFEYQWALSCENGINIKNTWSLIDNIVTQNIKVGIFEYFLPHHPDLSIFPGNKNPYIGRRPRLSPGHGTEVAGIIGARRGNNVGISGIADVCLVLLDHGGIAQYHGIYSTAFINSLIYAINNNIYIVNASFGFTTPTRTPAPPIQQHIHALINFGNSNGILIAAAGNWGTDSEITVSYPNGYANDLRFPCITNVISVGATNQKGDRWHLSNFSLYTVTIYAPCHSILTTTLKCTSASAGHFSTGYSLVSGTSFAAPHVTGVIALMRKIHSIITPEEIINVLQRSARQIEISIHNNKTQIVKFLDAYSAIKNIIFNYYDHHNDKKILGFNSFISINFDAHIVIPTIINGLNITKIAANAFQNQPNLSMISIPSSITYIGSNTFRNNPGLVINFIDRTFIPFNYFHNNWNSGNNLIAFKDELCGHEFATFTLHTNFPNEFHLKFCPCCRIIFLEEHRFIVQGNIKICMCEFSLCIGPHSFSDVIAGQNHVKDCAFCCFFIDCGLPVVRVDGDHEWHVLKCFSCSLIIIGECKFINEICVICNNGVLCNHPHVLFTGMRYLGNFTHHFSMCLTCNFVLYCHHSLNIVVLNLTVIEVLCNYCFFIYGHEHIFHPITNICKLCGLSINDIMNMLGINGYYELNVLVSIKEE